MTTDYWAYLENEYLPMLAGDVRDCPQCDWKHCVIEFPYPKIGRWECFICGLVWNAKGEVVFEPIELETGETEEKHYLKRVQEIYAYDKPFILYRLWDASDQLLYVGITKTLRVRMRSHGRHQIWWHHVARKTFEYYIDRKSLVHAETRAIKRERPKWNVCHNSWD